MARPARLNTKAAASDVADGIAVKYAAARYGVKQATLLRYLEYRGGAIGVRVSRLRGDFPRPRKYYGMM